MRAGSGNENTKTTWVPNFLLSYSPTKMIIPNKGAQQCWEIMFKTSLFHTATQLSATIKPNCRLKNKMSSNSFQDVYNHVCRFVTQLSMNGITPTGTPGPTGIHWHSERADGLSALSPCSDPPALDTQTLTTFSQQNMQKMPLLQPFFTAALLFQIITRWVWKTTAEGHYFTLVFTSHPRQSLKNGDIGPLNALVKAKSLNIYIKFAVDFSAHENGHEMRRGSNLPSGLGKY